MFSFNAVNCANTPGSPTCLAVLAAAQATHNCSSYFVQDQSICGGKLATYGPEKALLDAIGYDRTRELQTPILLGLALPALCLLRRKRMRSLR